MTTIRLLKAGVDRVLNGQEGMLLLVETFTPGFYGPVAHAKDYRYHGGCRPFQIWCISAYGYEIVDSY